MNDNKQTRDAQLAKLQNEMAVSEQELNDARERLRRAESSAARARHIHSSYAAHCRRDDTLDRFKVKAIAALDAARAFAGVPDDIEMSVNFKAPSNSYFMETDCYIEIQSCDYGKRPRRYSMNQFGGFNVKLIAAAMTEFNADFAAYQARIARA